MPKKQAKRIGLAIVGAGRVGLIRGEFAANQADTACAYDCQSYFFGIFFQLKSNSKTFDADFRR